MRFDCLTRKGKALSRLRRSVLAGRCCAVAANVRLAPLRELRFNLFLAIQQTLDRTLARVGLPGIKIFFNSPQSHVKRHVQLFPTFNQRPVHRAQQEVPGASPDKSVFDFSKVVEVVQGKSAKAKAQRSTSNYQSMSKLRTLDFGHWTLDLRVFCK